MPLVAVIYFYAMIRLAEQRLPQPMHRGRAHAGLEARAEINAKPVRRLMIQRGHQPFS